MRIFDPGCTLDRTFQTKVSSSGPAVVRTHNIFYQYPDNSFLVLGDVMGFWSREKVLPIVGTSVILSAYANIGLKLSPSMLG